MTAAGTETVLSVRHWTDTQFSFRTTRDRGLRFENGQFLMLGLAGGARPLLRAYSIASANHEEHLEFLSIKVPGGPLTSRLQNPRPGDQVLGEPQANRKPAARGRQSGCTPLPPEYRYRGRAILEPDQGSRALRALRAHRVRARGALGARERGTRTDRGAGAR